MRLQATGAPIITIITLIRECITTGVDKSIFIMMKVAGRNPLLCPRHTMWTGAIAGNCTWTRTNHTTIIQTSINSTRRGSKRKWIVTK